MAGKNIFNDKDSMDINELASLNDDISPELIEQLQQKITENAKNFTGKDEYNQENDVVNDSNLFEEIGANNNTTQAENNHQQEKKDIDISKNFDDNFLKKYKARLEKQELQKKSGSEEEVKPSISNAAFSDYENSDNDIEKITHGNITEKPLTKEQKNYNDSLDFLDGNIKYSKYVIYIDPQNVDFIESLTVKERKNLINKILREQDDIAITKQRFKVIQTVIRHAILAIITVAISIPVVYLTINASLEATINNYRRSQSIFQTLYKENGKITQYKKY